MYIFLYVRNPSYVPFRWSIIHIYGMLLHAQDTAAKPEEITDEAGSKRSTLFFFFVLFGGKNVWLCFVCVVCWLWCAGSSDGIQPTATAKAKVTAVASMDIVGATGP